MKNYLLIMLVAAAVAGCSTLGNQAITEPSNFLSIKVGDSDKATIYRKFGQPHDVVALGMKTDWRYIQAKTSPEPATFILGVIIWPLIIFSQTNYEISKTDFLFDTNGQLEDVSSRKGEFRKSLLSAGEGFSDNHKAAVARVKSEMESIRFPYDKSSDMALDYLAI